MSTNGRPSLERAGKIASFVLAWGIVAHQAWGTTYGRAPNEWLMMFAASILAPTVLQLLTGRGSTGSSESQASSASSSSSGSDSSGGSPREQS